MEVFMPYANNSDLPESVTKHLPDHAQDIYRSAFNSAWDEYKSPKERRNSSETREQVAHKVAWAAVKKKYTKKEDQWVEKS
jgi:cation transport regulator